MEEVKWRFPGNHYTADSGLDTADMETFKEDPIASLARELCQNSIDAKNKDKGNDPVRIEFKSFIIDRENIPGRDEIESQIVACEKTWSSHNKISKQLKEMESKIKMDKIACLRISDFNTTGLLGVSGNGGDKTPWHYLVHGSGISDKGATSGGSKGIGKFATFVNSYFNTVFYSTFTKDNEKGYEGICKLCSAYQEGTTEKTQGIGYFGSTVQNEPIEGQFEADDLLSRGPSDFGSDVYILGFKNPSEWKRDIISKVLDSFMSAIVFGTLEVSVDEYTINKDTVKEIVYNESLIKKSIRKSVISQYLLLTDKEHRFEDVITIPDIGVAKLYLINFDKEHESLATRSCVMIRYPYMKIKDIPNISTLPCSAMCIIENNDLNKLLREVENPQHTNWEFQRIDDPAERNEKRAVYNELLESIKRLVTEHLSSSDKSKTDLEGAGDYIPQIDPDNGSGTDEKKKKVQDKPQIQKRYKPETANLKASVADENGDGVSLDIGGDEGDETQTFEPEGHNDKPNGPIKPGEKPGEDHTEGDDKVIVKHAKLRSMSYRFFCINKSEKKYGIVFTSDYDEDEATFEMNALDEGGNRYPVMLDKVMLNGEVATVKDGHIVLLTLKHGEKYKLELTTDQEDLFSGEVKVYAYRK